MLALPNSPGVARQVADLLIRLRPGEVDPDARVFPGEQGAAMDGSALYRRYKKAQNEAELRPLRFHDPRHTFGTQAIAGGANVHDLQTWMGHRHLATTMRYVHYRPQGEGADLLGRRFAGTARELDELCGPAGTGSLAALAPTDDDVNHWTRPRKRSALLVHFGEGDPEPEGP